MFEPILDLSSDLEWMVQSGQASSEMLAEALVHEYYGRLYHLALVVFDDLNQAAAATTDAIATAILNLHRYRSAAGIPLWLYSTATSVFLKRLKALRAGRTRFGRKVKGEAGVIETPVYGHPALSDPRGRIVFFLHAFCGWSIADIGQASHISPQVVQTYLDAISEASGLEVGNSEAVSRLSATGPLMEALQVRWAPPVFTEEARTFARQQVIDQVHRRRLQRRRFLPLKELAFTGGVIMLVLGLVGIASRFTPDPVAAQLTETPPTPTPLSLFRLVDVPALPATNQGGASLFLAPQVAAGEMSAIASSPTIAPATMSAGETPLPAIASPPATQKEPLSMQSTPEEIIERIRQNASDYQTLWLDAHFNYYGPANYSGPPQRYRYQGWFASGIPRLEIYGLLQGMPAAIRILGSKGPSYLRPKSDGATSDISWYRAVKSFLEYPALVALNQFSRTGWGQRSGRLQAVEIDVVAGRRALVVDWLDPGRQRRLRLWLDVRIGNVLRLQEFGGPDLQRIISEVHVQELFLDVVFPEEIFRPEWPWQQAYAADYSGILSTATSETEEAELAPRRADLLRTPPPPGFEPAASMLTFQVAYSGPERNSPTNLGGQVVDVFADGYWLGSLAFRDSISFRCDRSPDGSRLAFAPWSDGDSNPDGSLYWLNLSDLSKVYRPMQELTASAFTFAPDGQRLAVFLDGSADMPAGIYLLEIGKSEYKLLFEALEAANLTWNPTGDYLAFVASTDASGYQWIILHVNSGQVSYRRTWQIDLLSLPEDSPLQGWGVELDGLTMGGMEACTAP